VPISRPPLRCPHWTVLLFFGSTAVPRRTPPPVLSSSTATQTPASRTSPNQSSGRVTLFFPMCQAAPPFPNRGGSFSFFETGVKTLPARPPCPDLHSPFHCVGDFFLFFRLLSNGGTLKFCLRTYVPPPRTPSVGPRTRLSLALPWHLPVAENTFPFAGSLIKEVASHQHFFSVHPAPVPPGWRAPVIALFQPR